MSGSFSWRTMIDAARGDEELVACTLDAAGMDRKFDPGFGGCEGAAFTAWTSTRVLFPVCYDGSEWVGSAPRSPTAESMASPLDHQGG